MKLQFSARDNEEVLKDAKVNEENKRKILLVGEYKKYFYYFFNEKETSIYTKTTLLDHKAVTYLVVSSPHTEIKAHEFEFPFFGSFPYLGFFKKDSAVEFAKDLEQDENLVTWIRPVYAYSSLGYFEDRILSSFFEYDDVELAELIFHELFHTLFFVKDEVELNENLASLFAREMLQDFFKNHPELKKYMLKEQKKLLVSKRVLELIGILQDEFKKLGVFITDGAADALTERFVEEILKPDLFSLCQKLELEESECELKEKWNQASFAAFLTYEEEQDFLEKLRLSLNLDLKQYLTWLRAEYKTFKKQDEIESFTDYLKQKVPHEAVSTH